MVDLFWIDGHVNSAAWDRVGLLPPLSKTCRSPGQVGDIRNGRIGAIGAALGRRQYSVASRQHRGADFSGIRNRRHVRWCSCISLVLSPCLPRLCVFCRAAVGGQLFVRWQDSIRGHGRNDSGLRRRLNFRSTSLQSSLRMRLAPQPRSKRANRGTRTTGQRS